MANHKNALKSIRKIEKRTAVNRNRVSRMRTFIKKFEKLIGIKESKPEEISEAFRVAQKEVMRGVTKGVIHKNTAARKVSQMSLKAKALEKK